MRIIRYYCHVLRVVCAYRNRLGKHAFAYYNVWDTCISMRNRILRLGHRPNVSHLYKAPFTRYNLLSIQAVKPV